MTPVDAILYWVVYLSGWAVLRGADEARGPKMAPRPTTAGVVLWCAVAIPSLLQFVLPGMLAGGQRDPAAISDGELWRLVTSMFLQDGGWLGTVINLVTLAVSVIVVPAVLTGTTMVAVFLVGGFVSNVLTIVILGESGAGNSMATMFMVAAAAVAARPWRGPGRGGVWPLSALIAAAVALLVLRNQHGLAVTSGLVVGVALSFVRRGTGSGVA